MAARKRYSKEFKLDAISLVTNQGYTRIEAARSLGQENQPTQQMSSELSSHQGKNSAYNLEFPTGN